MQTQLDPIQRVQVFRECDCRGVVRRFVFFTGDSCRRANFLRPDDVPPFIGPSAWFEVELISPGPWPTWRVLRPALPQRF